MKFFSYFELYLLQILINYSKIVVIFKSFIKTLRKKSIILKNFDIIL